MFFPRVRAIQLWNRTDPERIGQMCETKHLKEIGEFKSIHVQKANV